MEYSLRELKAEVKRDLRVAKPMPALVTLIYLAVSFAVTALTATGRAKALPDPLALVEQIRFYVGQMEDGIIGGQKMAEELFALRGEVFSLLWAFLLAALVVGLVRWTFRFAYRWYMLQVVRRRPITGRAALPLLRKWVWALLAGFLMEVFLLLWCVFFAFVGVAGSAALMIFLGESPWCKRLIVLLWAALAVWLVSVLLSYAGTNYILLDERVDGLDAIGLSKSMMRGRKRYLLVLIGSYGGWLAAGAAVAALVGWLCSAIGLGDILPELAPEPILARLGGGVTFADVLVRLFTLPVMAWLTPQLVGAQAKFFDWMKRTDIRNGVWESSRAEQVEAPRSHREQSGKQTHGSLKARVEGFFRSPAKPAPKRAAPPVKAEAPETEPVETAEINE